MEAAGTAIAAIDAASGYEHVQVRMGLSPRVEQAEEAELGV